MRSYRDPSWIGNDRLLVFNHGLLAQAGRDLDGRRRRARACSSGSTRRSGLPQIAQGEMTRQGDKLAALAGYSTFGLSRGIRLPLRRRRGYPAPPEPKCYHQRRRAAERHVHAADAGRPTAPQLALTESDGIHVFSNIPDLRAATPNCGQITDACSSTAASPAGAPPTCPAAAPACGQLGGGTGQAAARP